MAALGLGRSACPHLLSLVEMEALYARPAVRCACVSRSFCHGRDFGDLCQAVGALQTRWLPPPGARRPSHATTDPARPHVLTLRPPWVKYRVCVALARKFGQKPKTTFRLNGTKYGFSSCCVPTRCW